MFVMYFFSIACNLHTYMNHQRKGFFVYHNDCCNHLNNTKIITVNTEIYNYMVHVCMYTVSCMYSIFF